MELSILIPAYNEENRIGPTLVAYGEAIRDLDAEVLVIVNGSNDQSEALIRKEFLNNSDQLRLVVIKEKVGKGGALMRGIVECKGDKIAFTDADGSTPPDALLKLANHLQDSGIILGSRWMPESIIGRKQPLARRIMSRIFNQYVRLFFGLHVTDTQCGAKVMTRDAVLKILPEIGTTQWAFDVELLFQLKRSGVSLHEVPVEWNDVSGTKVKIFRASLEMAFALLRLRLIYSPFKGVIRVWDQSLGKKLYDRRMERMRSIYAPPQP